MTGVALITGASGGMGRAGGRVLGRDQVLFLTDIDADRTEQAAEALRREGVTVAGVLAGDLADPQVVDELVVQARAAGPLRSVFHTAGLSPALAGPEAIWKANSIATALLLRALENGLEEGLAAVLVASLAAHVAPPIATLEKLASDPLAPDFLEQAQAVIAATLPAGAEGEAAGLAYSFSKLGMIRMVEARSDSWGRKGARIVSLSPGMIDTTMGRREAESDPRSAAVLQMTPLGWGRAEDIADVAGFLLSDGARFITGCDIRVDGGATPMLKAVMAIRAG